jgi:predicted GIY-YIG superfamily endonuclease
MTIEPGEETFAFDTAEIEDNAPAAPGVYVLCDPSGYYLYVGQTDNIRTRLLEHLNDPRDCSKAHGATLFAFELHTDEDARIERRSQLVDAYAPVCNQMGR